MRGTLAVLALIAACKPDQNLGTFNAPPSATFLAPGDGETFPEGEPVLFRGGASDPDDDSADLLGRFVSDGESLCDEAAPGGIGEVQCTLTLAAGAYDITFEVRDPEGATDSEAISLTIVADGPPSVAILSPGTDTEWLEGQTIAFAAHVSDDESAAAELLAAWTSDRDGALEVDSIPDDDGNLSGFGTLSAGDHVITLTVTDPIGNSAEDAVAIVVQAPNRAPTCEITAPDGGGHSALGAPIAFAGTVDDPDQGPDGLIVTWSSDLETDAFATSTPDADGLVVATRDDLVAATHQITLRAEDDEGLFCTDQIAWSVGSPPTVVIGRPVDDDIVNVGLPVALEAVVTDGETAPADLVVTWTSDRDGVLGEGAPDTLGRSALTLTNLTAGTHLIAATVTDADALYATDDVTIRINALPSAPTLSISPTSPRTDDALQATIATSSVDPEGATVTYAYTWYKDGALSSASTTATLPASATARGETWRVQAAPFDGYGSGAPGLASVVIGNTPPVTATPTLSPANPTEAGAITCTPGATTDADGAAVWTYRYEWRVRGVVVGETSNALPPSAFAKGDEVICAVAASDGAAFGAASPSLPATVKNSPPTIGPPTILPAPAFTSSVLSASATSSDLDNDVVTWTYVWKKGGSPVGTAATLDGAVAFARGDRITVTLTPTDGAATGAPQTSAELVISNSPPTAPTIAITPPEPVVDQDVLVCAVTAASTDPDADGITLSYQWTRDGVNYGPAGAPTTVPADVPAPGELWGCKVTPTDSALLAGPTGTAAVRELLYGHVQWPCPSATVARGTRDYAFYGVVYDGATTFGGGAGSGVTDVWLGIGPDGSDPRVSTAWIWTEASYNGDINAFAANDKRNDEYVALANIPTAPGRYDYAFKVSPDFGVSWAYVDLGTSFGADACDAFQGNSDRYSPAQAGDLVVQ